jgi:hypothetical protein
MYGIKILSVFWKLETVYALACCCRNASDCLGVLAGEFLSIQNTVQDLATLSDFKLVPKLKEFFGGGLGRHFKGDEKNEE